MLNHSFFRCVGRIDISATVLERAVFRHGRFSLLLFRKVKNNRVQNHSE